MSEPFCTTHVSGDKYWRNKEGQFHRDDGPAIELPNGKKEWYQNGELHHIDGPAVEYADGEKEFYVRGEYCKTFKQFFDAIPEENREAALLFIAEFENV